MVRVYDYFDYRLFLRDSFAEIRKSTPSFSYRNLGRRVGFSSAGYVTKVLNGTCNMSMARVYAFAQYLKLRKQETEFFQALVEFNQSNSQAQKRACFEKLLEMRRGKTRTLDARQCELFDKWYYVVIREMLDYYLFKDDFAALASRLQPPISPAEARRAIETLESLGLIRRNPDGYYERVDQVISTGEQWHSMAVERFQREMIERGREAMDATPRASRDISTLTVSISKQTFDRMREKYRQFRQEMLEIARNDTSADRVYQMNLQFFPVTQVRDGEANP